ncbi:MAG: hypothetical protein L0387_32175 [Acidobacteria bacterium]|nr:hypothetical protein [Acidobacteriota bacterium]
MGLVMAVIALMSYYGYRETNPITGEKQHVAISQKQEVALGLQAAPQMAEQFGGLHPDANMQSLIKGAGDRTILKHALCFWSGDSD